MNWIQYLFEIAMLKDKPKRRVREKRRQLKLEKQRAVKS